MYLKYFYLNTHIIYLYNKIIYHILNYSYLYSVQNKKPRRRLATAQGCD